MNRPKPESPRSWAAALPWLGAFGVHALAALLLLQAGTESAQSNLPPRPDVEAVRVQAADEQLLQARRAAHRQLLREEELRKQRELQAKRDREARLKAEAAEKKKAEARRKAKEEAERRRAEQLKREQQAREKVEEEKRKAAAAQAEAEERVRAHREALAQRRQREAARRARHANIWRIAIKKKIERVWLQPPAVRIAPCEVVVEQDETGAVLSARVQGCRASRAWQESLRNAVLKASPLPPPPDPELFDRRLIITFHPKASR